MHRAILEHLGRNASYVGHRDTNGLNNQRSNLASYTSSQMRHKARKRLDATSQYKGVSWNSARGRWMASLRTKQAGVLLYEYCATELEAAQRYDAAAREHLGEFANLNFPDD